MATKRVTVRIDVDVDKRLRERCRKAGVDASFMIREALSRFLDRDTAGCHGTMPHKDLVMPPEAFSLTPPYRAWSGDLRVELRKRFLDLLALAYATAEFYPKTAGTREVYMALLEACHHLGIGDSGGHV